MNKRWTFLLLPVVVLGGLVLYEAVEKQRTLREFEVPAELELGDLSEAYFSGGCFWCSESDFEKANGVADVISGFAGGSEESPSYEEVSSGTTSHREAVLVYYDADVVSYEQLLDVYWRHIDPTDDGGQFADRGFQYSTAIYYQTEEEREIAELSREELAELGVLEGEIVTEILPFETFYPAEEYHQDYYKKNPLRYKYYRSGSGREAFIKETWGDELKHAQEHAGVSSAKTAFAKEIAALTPLQYEVTQEGGTETPFDNEYWDNEEAGIYVDVVSGEVLFSSIHKYESGTGWPSFTEPLEPENIVELKDFKLFVPRTEVRSRLADSHIGHVFKDGPPEAGGLRYCMNSAALRFIPVDELEAQGYGDYLELF